METGKSHPYLFFMLALSVLSLIMLAAMSVDGLNSSQKAVLALADNLVCVLFFGDFLHTLYKAPNRLSYFLRWGWLDLLSCVPMVDSLRVTRLARILRIVRLLRGAKILGQFLLARRAESAFMHQDGRRRGVVGDRDDHHGGLRRSRPGHDGRSVGGFVPDAVRRGIVRDRVRLHRALVPEALAARREQGAGHAHRRGARAARTDRSAFPWQGFVADYGDGGLVEDLPGVAGEVVRSRRPANLRARRAADPRR
jgi:hypothetical protein